MANRYWVGGTGSWDSTAGSKWAATSGGASGASAPTAADDVFLDAASGAGTVTTIFSQALCRSLDCTGFTGTLTLAASGAALIIGDASGGALKIVSGMGLTMGSGATIQFKATSDNGGAGWNITTGGKTMPSLEFGAGPVTGGKWVLQDAVTIGTTTPVLTLTAGTLDTNGQSITTGSFLTNNSNVRTLTMGSSSIAITTTSATVWSAATATNLTVTANTATMTLSGGSTTFAGNINYNGLSVVFSGSGTQVIAGGTFANITRTGTNGKSDALQLNANVTCTSTFTINGNSATNRVLAQSNTTGTARTIAAASVSMSNVDFLDITGAGAASWNLSAITGGSGDCGGNTGITFTASTTQTHTVSAGGNWSDVTKWTSRVPLPQDDVVVDVNTIGTLTADMPRMGRVLTFTGFAGTLASGTLDIASYGSLVLASGMTITGTGTWSWRGRSIHTITSAGKTLTQLPIIRGFGGTYTFQDALVTTQQLSLQAGTMDTNSQSVTCQTLQLAGDTVTRAAIFGTSVVTITYTGTGAPLNAASTNFTLLADSATFVISAASANTRTIAGGGLRYGTLTYTVAGSTGILLITGSNMFNTWNFSDTTNARLIRLAAGTTQQVQSYNVNGTVGKLTTFDTDAAGTPAKVSQQYVDFQNNVYSFFGTAKAKDGYLALDGVAGTYVSTPDSTALSITGDIDIRALAALNDWTPAARNTLIAKEQTSTLRSYRFAVETSGILALSMSSDGSTVVSATSSIATGITDGAIKWVRATWRQSDGRVQFFTSDNGVVWTQLGSNQTLAIASIADTTSWLEIGGRTTGGDSLAGKLYRAELRNGIDGTIVASPDFTGRSYNTHDYLSLKDSTASGYGVWYAGSHSTNVSGNSGWIFDDPQREGWGVLL